MHHFANCCVFAGTSKHGARMTCVFSRVCSGEEGLRPQAPVKPQRNRKAMSCDAGNSRDATFCIFVTVTCAFMCLIVCI